MDIFEAIALSLGLSMDVFAASISKGVSIKKITFRKILIISLWFCIGHAILGIIGFCLGSVAENFIESFDHWIAFALLVFIGINMIHDAVKKPKKGRKKRIKEDLSIKSLLPLSIAVSIDALTIGIVHALAYDISEALVTLAIVVVTILVMSILGVYVGHKIGTKYAKKAEIAGGIILIILGLKILLEHLGILF